MPRAQLTCCLRSSGFSYIGLLIVVAIISLIAASSVQIGAVTQRREAEAELLAVGLEFKRAVKNYFESTPAGVPAVAPRTLNDLLRDGRYPGVKRYLRKIYNDPLTGNADWGIIRSPDGGILGVYSKAQGEPIRRDNFPDEFFHFKGKKRYRDWVFVYGVVCTDAGCELPNQEGGSSAPAAASEPQMTPGFGSQSAPQTSER
jgi:type II secretory pathway pseudopilin PulG